MKIANTRSKKRVGVVYDHIQCIAEATIIATDNSRTAASEQIDNIQASVTVIVRNVDVTSIGGECETACETGSRHTALFCDCAPINRCERDAG